MEREQGSLEDRLRDFGSEPRPAILASLQSQLAEQKGRKRPAWWLLAAAIVFVGGVSTTFFFALNREKISHQALSSSTGINAPLAGGHNESETSSTITHHAPHQSGNTKPDQLKRPAENTIQMNPVSQSDETHSDKPDCSGRQNHQVQQSGDVNGFIATQAGESREDPSARFAASEPHRSFQKKNSNYAKTVNRNAGFEKSSRHVESSLVWQNSTKTTAQPAEDRRVTIAEDLSVSTFRRESGNETDNLIVVNSNAEQTQKVTDMETTKPATAAIFPNEQSANPKTEDVSKDLNSLSKDGKVKVNPKDTVLDSTATDSAKAPAGKRFSFSVIASSRYSGVRYYGINQGKSEFRNLLTDQNSAFPSRMTFETGCRLDYRPGSRFTLFGDLNLGYGKEDLFLLATSALPGQFDRTISGNSLILNPKSQTQKEHISASIWYSSVLCGFGIQMMPQLPVIRVGAGMQFLLVSDVTRKMESRTVSSGKMKEAAGVGFIRISAAKEIPFGTKGRLVVEPVVQYFLNPVYKMKPSTSILPLQAGVQVGWKW